MKLNYQLVASDLDGTLVPYCTNEVSEATVELVKRLRQNGIQVVIATGRSWNQTKPIVERLGITTPVIVQSGALIMEPLTGKTLYFKTLRPSLDQQLRQMERGAGIDHFFLLEDGFYYTASITTQGGEWIAKLGEGCRLVPRWQRGTSQVVKHLFSGSESELKGLSVLIRNTIDPMLNLVLWPPDQVTSDWFLEVFDPLSSKGQALQWVTNQLGIGMDAVIAFGDGLNDLDMLRQAGLGVAIAGSAPAVLAAADAVAEKPEADGVVQFINQLAAGLGAPVGANNGTV